MTGQAATSYLAAENWDEGVVARLAKLRETDPVHWSEIDQLWIVTRYEDVAYVSKNPQLFCSGFGVRPGNDTKLGLIDEDEPRHGAMRKWINKGFSPRMVGKLEPAFRQIVTETLDKVAKRGECDFVDDIAVPIPLLLIAEMIGIHKEDRDRFHHWSDTMISADGNMDKPGVMEKAAKAYIEYASYVTKIIEDRRLHPRDDLMSILVDAEEKGMLREYDTPQSHAQGSEEEKSWGRSELIKLLVVLMVAGNETTRNAISGAMQLLIEHPTARKRLIDDPSLIPAAVEEIVRWVTPVRSFTRTATTDTMLGGKKIAKGQQVLIVYTSANRDPEVFKDPDTFDIDRNPYHLGFGVGNHFCLGANLARMEIRVTLEEVLRRFPDMEYARGGPEFQPSPLVRTCKHMVVRYTPEG